jgi:hypothetical protein
VYIQFRRQDEKRKISPPDDLADASRYFLTGNAAHLAGLDILNAPGDFSLPCHFGIVVASVQVSAQPIQQFANLFGWPVAGFFNNLLHAYGHGINLAYKIGFDKGEPSAGLSSRAGKRRSRKAGRTGGNNLRKNGIPELDTDKHRLKSELRLKVRAALGKISLAVPMVFHICQWRWHRLVLIVNYDD